MIRASARRGPAPLVAAGRRGSPARAGIGAALAAACLVAVALMAVVQAATPAEPSDALRPPWRELLASDLEFARRTLESRYIYAVYPGGAAWREVLEPALAEARAAIGQVEDFAGYRGVMSRFVTRFQDPHLRFVPVLQGARYRWPGWTVRHLDGRYRIAVSHRAEVAAGVEIESCDGRPLHDWIDALAALENGVPGLEATRVALAPWLFVDSGNPLWRRPARCRIGGTELEPAWVAIAADRWAALAPLPVEIVDVPAGVSDFGDRGAWIRLPAMTPRTAAETATYRDLIARAPDLRGRDPIVFDVRGNGGGGYEWFMAILRGLYGTAFVDHHARERLKIRPVFVAGTYTPRPPGAPRADPSGTPTDPELEAVIDAVKVVRTVSGAEVTVLDARDERRRRARPGKPPASPVRGTVFLLTDAGCASACISFVDELLQVPGVRHVGADTMVDRRSGSALPHPLPSGLATLTVPSMVRERRERGENVPRLPAEKYTGDVQDTAAVQRWILHDLWPVGRR